MKPKLQFSAFLFSSIFLSSLILNACGDGSIQVTPGNLSNLSGEGGNITDTPEEFFTDNIFPLFRQASGSGGCASSGCHLVGAAALGAQTFFQVDPDSSTESWNWASVRRTSLQTGDFASGSSDLIKNRKNDGHEAFANTSVWSDLNKALIDSWSSIVE